MNSKEQNVRKGGFLIFLFFFLTILAQAQQKPTEEMPLLLFPKQEANTMLVVFITGDGGWNTFSQQMCKTFANRGYSVVALDSKKYFWSAKTPERFSHDMEYVINHFMKEWKKSSVIITGYSFGADVVAFLPKQLSAKLKEKISLMALISPGSSSDFEIHISDLFSDKEPMDRTYKTKAEIQQSALQTVCIFGMEEKLVLKNELTESATLSIIELPGSHHFNNDTEAIVKQIQIKLQNSDEH